MKFGPLPVEAAAGTVLAHGLRAGKSRWRKGHLLTEADVAALEAAGVGSVIVAKAEPGDVDENTAAAALAAVLTGPGITAGTAFTGRANLYADAAGVIEIDRDAVIAANGVDEAITLATLPSFARVAPRQMIATAKIIPYAVKGAALEKAKGALGSDVLRLHPFRLRRARLILTQTPDLKPSLLTKAETATRARLEGLGIALTTTEIVAHEPGAVAGALAKEDDAEAILIFGATATSDRADACPQGLIEAGGTISRFGMPVDPGNLLFLGALAGVPVIGLPGCARSPALNGVDWVLERIAAGLTPDDRDFAAMGYGGLLKEIPTRPQPRQGNAMSPARPRIGILLLAAGQSRRMQGRDKLVEAAEGEPLLRRAARAGLAASADKVAVVLPPDHQPRRAALAGCDVHIIEAQGAAAGMAVSLAAGISAMGEDLDGIIVALADMPDVTADHYNALIAAFDPSAGRSIARAMSEDGTPGHPVLFGRRFFEALSALGGDSGAKAILAEAGDYLVEVPTPGKGAITDLDTPEAWAAWRKAQET